MPSYEHKRLVERIKELNQPPTSAHRLTAWLEASQHIEFLEDNSKEQEIVIWARNSTTSIQGLVVREDRLHPLDKQDLLRWQGNGFEPRADFFWQAETDDVVLEESRNSWGADSLSGAQRLVFGRHRRGFGAKDGAYFEPLQEYLHATDLHWLDYEGAYCSFDGNGDLLPAISMTMRNGDSGSDLVSFRREPLERYLAATKSLLVRLFDFEFLTDPNLETDWSDMTEAVVDNGDQLFAKRWANPTVGSGTRGVQILAPKRPLPEILKKLDGEGDAGPFQEFIAHDVRNNRVTTISTDPAETTNFFEAAGNSLPFGLSPAFFSPEVLSRYKTDRQKYTVDEKFRTITSRAGWQLRSFDVNDAGQVFAYIVYLRELPYSEQQYWKVFNEEAKAGIPERSFRRDFGGVGATPEPLVELLIKLEEWHVAQVTWWKLRNARLLEQVNTPYSGSRDEWAQAFEDLAKLVVEGFETTAIRTRLGELLIPFSGEDRTIALLEKLLLGEQAVAKGERLSGLREAQQVRTMVAAHTFGQEAHELESQAKLQHGSFAAHFQSVCKTIIGELEHIEKAFATK